MVELRRILLGEEKTRLDRLQARLDNPSLHSQDVAEVLPNAVQRAVGKGEQLTRALEPTVEGILRASVKKNPRALADALSPVMMPAIRRSIADFIKGMVQSLNQTLEHSLSVKSIRWRMEARRTGVPFAEIVLLRTLQYRVEQVFLTHPESGLSLCHVAAGTVAVESPEIVSGMLTAIQDFVRDSFHGDEGDGLEAFEVGRFTVWVARGPLAVIAAVVRGHPPAELRTLLRDVVDRVHRDFGDDLASFAGDTTPFDICEPYLEECCIEAATEAPTESKPATPTVVLILATIVLGGVGLWWLLRGSESNAWSEYIVALRREPGLVVLEEDRSGGQYRVRGLRDPFATAPDTLLADFGLDPDDVAGEWEPYVALHPSLVLERAGRILNPPADIEFEHRAGTLVVEGRAPHRWIQRVRDVAPLLAGVERVDLSGVIDLDLRKLAREATAVEHREFPFWLEDTHFDFDGDILQKLTGQLEILCQHATDLGRKVILEVVVFEEPDPDEKNRRARSQAWAEQLRTTLEKQGLTAFDLLVTGAAAPLPFPDEVSRDILNGSGRVTLHVVFRPSLEGGDE